MKKIVFENVHPFSLSQTLDCGQCFRWKINDDDSFIGVVNGVVATVKYEGTTLTIDTNCDTDREMWSDYFDLSLDYMNIKESLSQMHPVLMEASTYAGGIRILNQQPFEALISFIISQNNNISRIKGIVERLCENFGEKTNEGFAFPTAEKIAVLTVEDLAILRSGFRAKYILDAA